MNRIWVSLLCVALLVLPLMGCAGQGEAGYAVHAYTRSDACGAAETWAVYLGDYHQEDLRYTAVYGDPGLAEAVKRDTQGIGYNNLNYAYDAATGRPVAGLCVVPIDVNGNGRLDPEEDFYDTKEQLTEAIASGQYPSPPARDLHLVTKNEFSGVAKVFVAWVLTDGQQYVDEVGYVALPADRVEVELGKLGDVPDVEDLRGDVTISGAWALYPMVVSWADEFKNLYPGVNFHISAGGAGKGMMDALSGMVDIGMVSREIYPAEIEKGAHWVSVTKDAVVPVVNENNPVLDELLAAGVTRQAFAEIWVTGTLTDWRDVVNFNYGADG